MFYSANTLLGYTVHATDGPCGNVRDLLFTDDSWGIRYFVMRPTTASGHRDLLISIARLEFVNEKRRAIGYRGPASSAWSEPYLDSNPPISRQERLTRQALMAVAPQQKLDLLWGFGSAIPPRLRFGKRSVRTSPTALVDCGIAYDPHLRSCREVIGYRVQSPDGKAGHVSDILISTASWDIAYLVVDSRRWFHANRVVLPVQHVHGISWPLMRVSTLLTKKAVHALPPDTHTPATHDYRIPNR